MTRITVMIVDDHPVILRGLCDLFENFSDLQVVAEEADGASILGKVAEFRPDVLVLDYQMPNMSAPAIIAAISRDYPTTRVVVLSMHSSAAYIVDAFRNGALGYVLKCVDAERIVEAIREAYLGRKYLSPPLDLMEVERYALQSQRRSDDVETLLTDRERDVFLLVAEGRTTKEIADQLGVGVRTVESHRANILSKLGLKNQLALVRYAVERKLVSERDDP